MSGAIRHRDRSGTAFTLVELAVVASILVVLSAVSFPSLVQTYEEQKLRQSAIELQSHLLRGRTLARRLQSLCTFSVSTGATVQVTGNNACASANLSSLNLTQLIGVRGLCISNNGSSVTSCTAPDTLTFLPLGVLAGSTQTLYLAGSGTSAQFCVELSLTLIRVGNRNGNSGACRFNLS